jgi:hypothetical protein
LWSTFFAELREQQKQAGKPPFTRIEQLVDQVLFNPAIPGQKISYEQIGQLWLFVSDLHGLLGNGRNTAVFQRCRGCDTQGVTVHAAFAKELAGSQDSDHGLLVMPGKDREFDLAFLDVVDGVGDVALLEDIFVFFQSHGFSCPRLPWRESPGL